MRRWPRTGGICSSPWFSMANRSRCASRNARPTGFSRSHRPVTKIVALIPLSTSAVAMRSSKAPGQASRVKATIRRPGEASPSRMRGSTGTSRAVIRRERDHGKTAGAASKVRRDRQRWHIVERSPTAGSGCTTSYGIRRGSNGEASRDDPMTRDAADIPAELRVSFDAAPSVETRAALGHEINEYHGRTVPQDARRFALPLHDENNRLGAGLSGVLSWQWLFVEALWVSDDWRSRGIGRALLAQAEVHAVAAGCHSVWQDTFSGFRLLPGTRLSTVRAPQRCTGGSRAWR